MPDVTIIIPTCDRLWSLPAAIASARGTRCEVEILVAENGTSPDAREWLASQQGLRVLHLGPVGHQRALNAAVAEARGDFLRFLDDDDVTVAAMIDLQLEAARAAGADVAYSRVDRLDHDTGATRARGELGEWDDMVAAVLWESRGWHLGGMLVRRDLAAQTPRRPEFALAEDWVFLLELALRDPPRVRVEGVASFWVHHGRARITGATQGGLRGDVATWQRVEAVRMIVRRLAEAGALTDRRRAAASRCLWTFALRLSRRHPAEAGALAAEARELAPGELRAAWPPEPGTLGRLHRLLGFGAAERLRHASRRVRVLAGMRPAS